MTDLNREVAEKVMGWKWYVANPGSSANLHWKDCWVDKHDNYCASEYFYPSTNIADAWQVVELMRELGYVCIVAAVKECVRCAFHEAMPPHSSQMAGEMIAFKTADTAPEAICKAALEAIGAK